MNSETSLLLTDLYQLTMLEAYYQENMLAEATFDFYVRGLPSARNYLVAAGIQPLVAFLEQARFSEAELKWLADSGRFSDAFIDYLAQWRFSGDLYALPEGTPFFTQVPVARVTASLVEAQLVESRLINLLSYSTLIASKAARCVQVAPGKVLVDFGLRRAHGAEAGVLAARACYLAGFAGTATVLNGPRDHIPLYGTMAHSYIQAHEDEAAAFTAFVRAQPNNTTLLIDTYDTEVAAAKVVTLADQLRAQGIEIHAVRLDSGDLAAHARAVRQILDDGGHPEIEIFASGNLDEFSVEQLEKANAPIDGYGIGTKLATSADAPYMECAYKLSEYAGQGRRKRSEHKASWPGRKQAWRRYDAQGMMTGDILGLEGEAIAGEPLLVAMMKQGERTRAVGSLEEARDHLKRQMERLPRPLRALVPAPEPYPVTISDGLQQAAKVVDARLAKLGG